jgi:hypothetical protein
MEAIKYTLFMGGLISLQNNHEHAARLSSNKIHGRVLTKFFKWLSYQYIIFVMGDQILRSNMPLLQH